jgi:hypothetical protein
MHAKRDARAVFDHDDQGIVMNCSNEAAAISPQILSRKIPHPLTSLLSALWVNVPSLWKQVEREQHMCAC